MQSFDRLRMKGRGLRMKGKRLRMKVLVDEDRLEDQDAIALRKQCNPWHADLLDGIVKDAEGWAHEGG